MTLEELVESIKGFVKQESEAKISSVLTQAKDILIRYQGDQAIVEKTMEDDVFAALELANPGNPLLVEVKTMLDNADKAHTDLINQRNEALKGLWTAEVGGW